tara:strand:- start:2466 stop:2642 length:177 start_codon:yes stop_codon:yes gene_type:complete
MPLKKCEYKQDGIKCDDGYFYSEDFIIWPEEYAGGDPIEVKEVCPECNGEGVTLVSDK